MFRQNSRGRFRGRSRFNSRSNRVAPKPQYSYAKYIAKATPDLGEKIYKPINKFADFDVDQRLKTNIAAKGYVNPTKIQDLSIPVILKGKDVIGLASTGSGKTAAFLIPLINKSLQDRNQKTLIIVPTRELAEQIYMEFRSLVTGFNLYATVVIGGASMFKQISLLRKNPQFVIGTPGRLKDLTQRKNLNLANFNNIVLDEVDRMLDMGFVRDIKLLISLMPKQKQSLFFSATMDAEAERIAGSLLTNPEKIETESGTSSKNVEQNIVKLDPGQNKIDKLHDILIMTEVSKTLIFARTKFGADRLARNLHARGFKVDSIHGNKSQSQRSKVIQNFKQEVIKVLVATDVAARGIDIADISHVINFDEPATYQDYIHRIGRTGRAGKSGKALTFID